MVKLSEAVRAKRKELGLSQTEFGELVGQRQTTISDWEKGNIAHIRNWKKLSTILGISEREMLGMIAAAGIAADKTERMPAEVRSSVKKMSELSPSIEARIEPAMGMRDVPVYGRAQGGPDGKFEFNGEIMGWETRPHVLLGVRDAYSLYVDGESMYPRYKPGETVWMNPSKPIHRGKDVIVQLHPDNDGDSPYGFIKEFVAWTPQYLVVCQHNPKQEIKYHREEVKSVHVIVYHEP